MARLAAGDRRGEMRDGVWTMVGMITAKTGARSALGAFALALIAVTSTGPARAGDDGAAPLWIGIGSVVGLTRSPNEDAIIEYREHSKLVVPPKMDLPKPGVSAAASPAWPLDQEVDRLRKIKAEENNPFSPLASKHVTGPNIVTAPVEVSATTGFGPGGGACLKNGQAVACPDSGKAAEPAATATGMLNPLTWVGIQKKQIVLGPEPERKFLTDPPKGFRDPAEGVGAKVDAN